MKTFSSCENFMYSLTNQSSAINPFNHLTHLTCLTPLTRSAALAVAAMCATLPLRANDWHQWRGPHRDGVSQETGLLKEWPTDGPKLLWQVKDIGSGYSTPSVVGDRLYLLGNDGVDNEFVEALAVKDGNRVWSAKLGKVGNPDQQPDFPAARSTPTMDGRLCYAPC